MNDKDKEAFEKWYQQYFKISGITILNIPHHFTETWQAACEYKQAEIDEVRINANDVIVQTLNLSREMDKLQAENAKLRECVEFYADEKTWNKRSILPGNIYSPQYMSIEINYDAYLHEVSKDGAGYSGEWYKNSGYVGGKRARQVLKELDEK